MSVTSLSRRLVNGDIQYVIGRFQIVRSAYGGFRRLTDNYKAAESGARAERDRSSSLFREADVDRACDGLKTEAVYVGLNIPASLTTEILAFAQSEPLHAIYDRYGPTFRYLDVVDGTAPDGRRIPVGGVPDPIRCPAVRRIVEDPILREIVRKHLGHDPKKFVTILDWTFASSMSDDDRRRMKHGVIDYHYDVGGLNFVYASFYITDTDRYSGAHVMMRRSHRGKPLRMLWGSARASEKDVRKEFGIENELVIEGPAGTGFIQDTSCFHRASPPKTSDRLMLAIRFIN
mgnify:CR=1 FL=1